MVFLALGASYSVYVIWFLEFEFDFVFELSQRAYPNSKVPVRVEVDVVAMLP